jgi:hypothetical protein
VPILILVSAAMILPAAIPILPIDEFAGYWHAFERLAMIPPDEKVLITEPVPHNYSWSFGWEEMTAAVARSYNSLPPEERTHTALWANDFGAAGAIDYFGPKYGLPKAISGHQNYWLWGPRDYSGQTMILVATPIATAHSYFEEVTIVERLNNPYAPPWENRPILLCCKPRFVSLAAIWPEVKNWE